MKICATRRIGFAPTPETSRSEAMGERPMRLNGDGIIGYLVGAKKGFLITTDPDCVVDSAAPGGGGA